MLAVQIALAGDRLQEEDLAHLPLISRFHHCRKSPQ